MTDAEGRYRVRHDQARAPTRGATTTNAWRPAHIHFSLFGRAFTQRLVTQMYFPGDPLFEFDPIFNSVRDEQARAADDLRASTTSSTQAGLGARLPLGHRAARRDATPIEELTLTDARRRPSARTSRSGCRGPTARTSCPAATPAHRPAVCSTATGEPIPDALIETWQADPAGRFEAEGFRGFGRCPTDADGRWEIFTVKPGAAGDAGAAHRRRVFARGLLNRVRHPDLLRRRGRPERGRPGAGGLDERRGRR